MSVSIDHSFSIHEFFLFQEYYPSLFSKFPRDRDSSSSYFFGDLARIARARKKEKRFDFHATISPIILKHRRCARSSANSGFGVIAPAKSAHRIKTTGRIKSNKSWPVLRSKRGHLARLKRSDSREQPA